MINYILKREQESNDNKGCKAIQFYYQKIVFIKGIKKLFKKSCRLSYTGYHWQLKMTGLWVSAEIYLFHL